MENQIDKIDPETVIMSLSRYHWFTEDMAEDVLKRFLLFSTRIVTNPSGYDRVPFDKKARVYFLMQGDYVAYVGKTVHLAARVSQHVSDGKEFDYVAFVDVENQYMDVIEAFNINYHNPALNAEIPSIADILRMVGKSS